MTAPAAVAQTVAMIHETARELGCTASADVAALTDAVADLERKRVTVEFDYEKFATKFEAVCESRALDKNSDISEAVGVGPGVVARVREAKPVEWESVLKIIAWSNIDLRTCIRKVAAAA